MHAIEIALHTRSADNRGLDSQSFSQTSLCLLLSSIVCELTFAKPHKANNLNLTSLAPAKPRFC